MLTVPQGGNKKGTLSQNSAATYFSIVKAGLNRAFINEYLTVDIAAKVKGIPELKAKRETLTLEEAELLAQTPCENEVLKRAFFFAILTGIRLCATFMNSHGARYRRRQQAGVWTSLNERHTLLTTCQ